MNPADRAAIEQHGFAIVDSVLSPDRTAELLAVLKQLHSAENLSRRGRSGGGIRNLLRLAPAICLLSESREIRALVEPVLGAQAIAVRGIFFDKTPVANWSVAWHQDLAIPIKKRLAMEGFGPWSVKAGVPHALAPASVLEQMLTIRLHLDDASESNGALRVMPGSHRFGRMSDEEIEKWEREATVVTCAVARGGVLAMRPLLLHASHSSQQPAHRRVIHLEFAAEQLPGALEWQCA